MARPIVKLLHGADSLDLMSGAGTGTGRYKVGTNFAPPTAQRAVTYSSALRGSDVAQKRLENSPFNFSVHIKASSPQEVERGKRELQSFLNRAGQAEPLYLAYRSYDDYDFEPFFGLQGAFMRYEIVHGSLGASGTVPIYTANTTLNVPVNLIIKPQAIGPQQHSGQATGGIFEDYIGTGNGKSRGTVFGEATSNLVPNPAFMHGTYNTNWAETGCLDTENKNEKFILFGDTSVRLEQTAADGTYVDAITLTVATYITSFYAKRDDSSAVTSDVVQVNYNGSAVTTTYVSVGGGWYWCYASFTGAAASQDVGVILASTLSNNNQALYLDGIQCEQNDHPTPFCYGDMLGCTWAGTKNDSTSTRAAARLRYEFDEVLNKLSGYTIRLVWLPRSADITATTYLFEDNSDDLALQISTSEVYRFFTNSGSNVTSSSVTLDPETPEILHLTYDGSTATIYRNGTSIGSGTTTFNTSLPVRLFIGTDDATGNHMNGTIMGFATFQQAMTQAQVTADHAAVAQQAADRERVDPLPWFWTSDGDNVIDNEMTGSRFCYSATAGHMGDDLDLSYFVESVIRSDTINAPGMSWGVLPAEYRHFDKDILDDSGTNTLLFLDGDDATANANANNAVVDRISLGTTEVSLGATAKTVENANVLRHAKSVTGWFVGLDASANANVQVKMRVNYSGDAEDAYDSPWRTLTTDTSLSAYVTHELQLDIPADILSGQSQVGFEIRVQRTAGASTENFDLSHIIFMINYSSVYTGDLGGASPVADAFVNGRTLYATTGNDLFKARRHLSRPLVIEPNRLNILFYQNTFHRNGSIGSGWDDDDTVTISQFRTAPRFDIF